VKQGYIPKTNYHGFFIICQKCWEKGHRVTAADEISRNRVHKKAEPENLAQEIQKLKDSIDLNIRIFKNWIEIQEKFYKVLEAIEETKEKRTTNEDGYELDKTAEEKIIGKRENES